MCLFCLEAKLKLYEYSSLETPFYFMGFVSKL